MADAQEKRETYVSIWTKAVETQMHFNEMSVKSRQLGLTFVAAALGIGIVLLSKGEDFSIYIKMCGGTVTLHIAVGIIFGAMLALWAVRELDLNVYHKMLRGAVAFGEDFEKHYMKELFDLEKGMTQAISHFSRFEDAEVEVKDDGRYHYRGTKKVTAYQKLQRFYNIATGFLAVVVIALLFVTNFATWDKPTTDGRAASPNGIQENTK